MAASVWFFVTVEEEWANDELKETLNHEPDACSVIDQNQTTQLPDVAK